MIRLSNILVVTMVCLLGCQRNSSSIVNKSEREYVKTVLSAREVLPYAIEIERVFPVADHLITHYAFDEGPNMWTTEAYFGGRYIMAMQVYVQIDYESDTIVEVLDSPQFVITEASHVDMLPDGRAHLKLNPKHEKRFTLEQWRSIVESGGDFSAVGLTLNHEPVPYFQDFVSQSRAGRIHVSLLGE